MKTFYLTTLLLALGIATNAQTEKGTLNINGLFGSNGGGVYQSNNASNQFKLNFGANVGYFVKNNWEVGAGVQTGFYTLKNKPPFDNFFYVNRSITLAPQLYSKYYFTSNQVRPFAVVSTGYNWQFNRMKNNGIITKGSSGFFNYGGGAGLAWFPSQKVGLFTQLTYDQVYEKYVRNEGALNLNFGVQINLGKKK